MEELQLALYNKNTVVWYIQDVNMNCSFKTLERMAIEKGAKLDNGDLLVAENANKTCRKFFKKTKNAALILYIKLLNQNTYTQIRKGEGRIKGQGHSVDQFLS